MALDEKQLVGPDAERLDVTDMIWRESILK
jgi:hypothetical protein